MTYRPGANRNLRAIANELGVAKVIEGTVRRSGNCVRIATRLVDAYTGEALWSDSYDRDLTNIFAIQSEIAQTVASRLRAQLSPDERKDVEEKPTDNLEAYDLYLQAKQLLGPKSVGALWSSEKERWSKAVSLLEEATQKDNKFALAYCMIARAHDYLYADQIDRTPERRALADAAINEALRLRPDLAEVHLALAAHIYYCYSDVERVRVQIAIAAKALPNNSDLLELTALIDQGEGLWDKATSGLERAAALDPRNPELLEKLAWNYEYRRRYRDNERILDRLIDLEPDMPWLPIRKARSAFSEKADLKSICSAFEAVPSSIKDDPQLIGNHAYFATCARDFAAAEEIFSKSQNEEVYFNGALVPHQIGTLWIEFLRGKHPTTEQFGAAREQLYRKVEAARSDPSSACASPWACWGLPSLMAALAWADVALGRDEEAIEEGRRSMEMLPISEDAFGGPEIAAYVAVVYAWTNRPDSAFEQLSKLVEIPCLPITYGALKTDPSWDPLRKDPRFDKLLAELAPKD
jgi:tetratricopeptide (TPR) repeat protein